MNHQAWVCQCNHLIFEDIFHWFIHNVLLAIDIDSHSFINNQSIESCLTFFLAHNFIVYWVLYICKMFSFWVHHFKLFELQFMGLLSKCITIEYLFGFSINASATILCKKIFFLTHNLLTSTFLLYHRRVIVLFKSNHLLQEKILPILLTSYNPS